MKSRFKKTFHESCKKIIRGNILELELKKKKGNLRNSPNVGTKQSRNVIAKMREESRMIIEERKRRERNDAGHAIHRRLAKDNWRLLVDSAEDRWPRP